VQWPTGKELTEWKWLSPDATTYGTQFDKEPDHFEVIGVPDFVKNTIIENYIKRSQGKGDALAGHRDLARLKVAAVLMWMDGRTEAINAEDWDLAGQIMAHSDLTRDQAQEYHNQQQAQRADAIAANRGRRAAIEDTAKESHLIDRTKEKILTILKHGRPMRKSDVIGSKMTASLRPVAENALDQLLKAKKVKVTKSKNPTNNQTVIRVQLTEDNLIP
jgi:hypothetical protein